jgi:hypothetical protein
VADSDAEGGGADDWQAAQQAQAQVGLTIDRRRFYSRSYCLYYCLGSCCLNGDWQAAQQAQAQVGPVLLMMIHFTVCWAPKIAYSTCAGAWPCTLNG